MSGNGESGIVSAGEGPIIIEVARMRLNRDYPFRWLGRSMGVTLTTRRHWWLFHRPIIRLWETTD